MNPTVIARQRSTRGSIFLELLAGVDGGLTQAEISKKLERSPNEFYRMLDRLVRRGYVTRIDGDRYSSDAEAVRLGATARTCPATGILRNAADARPCPAQPPGQSSGGV